ncbi:MAG: extracellular solute-binding protein [Chloroflexi bacterium]|nr:extracellular solute-binding protein [Chloroflexota bacterium]
MRKHLGTIVSLAVLLSIVALACGQRPVTVEQPPPASAQVSTGASVRGGWEEDWERTLAAARKEGQVNVYANLGPEWRQAFIDVMEKKYSMTVDALMGTSAEIAERIMREQRLKINNADLVLSISASNFDKIYQPAGVLQPLEKMLVLPEVIDPKAWWRGELTWLDPDEKTLLAHREYVAPPTVINTDMVKPGELKSWNDLLDPKWKGKIVIMDPTIGGAGSSTLAMLAYAIKDWDFVRALVKQELNPQRNNRLAAEWVARGRYPILIGPSKGDVFPFMQAGAPIEYFTPSEGTYSSVGGGGTIAQLKGSPHPNAAKIFINFLLSKEGQTLQTRTTGFQSMRVDVPTDHLDPTTVLQPGMKYYSTIEKGFREKETELQKEVTRIFEASLKK